MSLANACKPPSIVYAMQGPFPMEIYQGTEFIIIKLEYFDMMRVVFMDGRKPDANTPHSKIGLLHGPLGRRHARRRDTHLSPATITNNGLAHSDKVRVIERFRLGADGKALTRDPGVRGPRGARQSRRAVHRLEEEAGDHVYPYECDPTFALEYQNQIGVSRAARGRTEPRISA